MQAVPLSDHTHVFKAPSNWIADNDGPCSDLEVYVHRGDNGDTMISAWKPSNEEVDCLQNGGYIYLHINSISEDQLVHPVVAMDIH